MLKKRGKAHILTEYSIYTWDDENNPDCDCGGN